MPKLASPRPKKYESRHQPGLHKGQVTFTGSTTIDLGINHNNFDFVMQQKGALAALNAAPQLAWDYGTKKGTVVITAGKYTAAGDTTIIAATAACTVSFMAHEEASIRQD